MKAIALLTMWFLPATFVSVGQCSSMEIDRLANAIL